jgi:hypothetical protein
MSDHSKFTPMTKEEMELAVYMAILLHIEKLPQLKGKGRQRDKEQSGITWFAKAVCAQLQLSNSWLIKGPPCVAGTTPKGPPSYV